MPLFISAILFSAVSRGGGSRSFRKIRSDFRRIGNGVEIKRKNSLRCLRALSEETYQALLTRLTEFYKTEPFVALEISRAEELRPDEIEALTDELLGDSFEGNTLVLRDLDEKISRVRISRGTPSHDSPAVAGPVVSDSTPPEGTLAPVILDAIADLRGALDELFAEAGKQGRILTMDDVWRLVDAHKAKLEETTGKFNICVNVPNPADRSLPIEQRRWIRISDSRKWTSGEKKYRLPGCVPTSDGTLGSIIRAEGRVFDVDINDLQEALVKVGQSIDALPANISEWPEGLIDRLKPYMKTFIEAGIEPSWQSIVDDLKGTHPEADTRMLFIRVRNEAIVHCHALVSDVESDVPSPLLPNDQTEAQRVTTALESYFRVPLSYLRRVADAQQTSAAALAAERTDVLRRPVKTTEHTQSLKEYTTEDLGGFSTGYYLSAEDRKYEVIKLRDGTKVTLECIVAGEGRTIRDVLEEAGTLEQARSDLQIATGYSTGINKDDAVEQYLDNATMLFVARNLDGEFMGYRAVQTRFVGGDKLPLAYIWANYVLDKYQGEGLGGGMNYRVGRYCKKALGLGPLRGYYNGLRTWNAAVLRLADSRWFKVFPRPTSLRASGLERGPNSKEMALIGTIANELLGASYESETGIVITPITPPKKVATLGIEAYDGHFSDKVRVQDGRSQIVVLWVPPLMELIYPIREAWIRGWRRFLLPVVRPVVNFFINKFLSRLPLLKNIFKVRIPGINWDKYAEAYPVLDKLIPYRETKATLVEFLDIQPDDVIGDLGSGIGLMSETLRAEGAQVVSVENNAVSMAKHQQRNPQAEIIDFDLNADEPLPIASQVTKICSNHVVNYLQDFEAHLRRIHEALPERGVVAMSILSPGFSPLKIFFKGHLWPEIKAKGFRRAWRENWPMNKDLGLVGKINEAIKAGAVEGGYFKEYTKEEIETAFRKAGFEVLEIRQGYVGGNFIVKARKIST